MKKSVYKSAMSHVRTSENFKETAYRKLMREAKKTTTSNRMNEGERISMNMAKKRKATGWAIGIAACAVLALGIFTLNQNGPTTSSEASPQASAPPSAQASTLPGSQTTSEGSPPSSAVATKPPIMGKVAVNIEGAISEVSADGKSFKVGDLWVEITDQTRMGSSEPTAAAPSEDLLQKEFKVGNIVSGYTSQDVSTGKVTADVIYNNMAPQK